MRGVPTVPAIDRAVDAEVLGADAPVSPQGSRVVEEQPGILRARGQISVDPFLLLGGYLQGQEIYRLVLGLLLNELGDQQLGLRQRMNVAQEHDLVLPNRQLQETKGIDRGSGENG